jgi:hypothetical protein
MVRNTLERVEKDEKEDHKHQLSRQTAIDVVLNVVLNAFLTVESGASYTQPQEGGVGGGGLNHTTSTYIQTLGIAPSFLLNQALLFVGGLEPEYVT